jgi:hypothetical protein
MISLLLAACAAAPKGRSGECSPEAAAWAIGHTISDALASKVMKETGASHTRVLRPNQPSTMDFRNDRLDIEVDDQGVIASIRRG